MTPYLVNSNIYRKSTTVFELTMFEISMTLNLNFQVTQGQTWWYRSNTYHDFILVVYTFSNMGWLGSFTSLQNQVTFIWKFKGN